MSCVFCDIAAGRIPAKIVRSDDRIVAFHDIAPRAPTHVVVIPKEHVESLDAAKPGQEALLGALLLAARGVAAELGLRGGYRVVVNRGPDGGQTVDHLHLHVLGGRAMGWPPG
jgi:histidine triad (HIT) family protein